ncbi:MAG: hypothetical protein R2867_17860 [Caldilineaceae bacterium]
MSVPKHAELATGAGQRLLIRTFGLLAIDLHPAPLRHTPLPQPTALKFETRTIEALLIYLACQVRPVSRDLLAELLWPERTRCRRAPTCALPCIAYARQLAPFLLVTRQRIALNPHTFDLDAGQFETHLTNGQLDQATALYHGDFLTDFYLDESPPLSSGRCWNGNACAPSRWPRGSSRSNN